jgi:hypothetical protein
MGLQRPPRSSKYNQNVGELTKASEVGFLTPKWQQSVSKIASMTIVNLVTPKVGAKLEI